MKPIVILGAGGFAREVMWVVRELGKYEIKAFLDETISDKDAPTVHAIPVIRSLDQVALGKKPVLVCGTGNNGLREKWARMYGGDYAFETVIHPSARLGPNVEIGIGTVITAGCVLTVDIRLGDHINLNLNCTVGHDTVIGSFCNISPGCGISGNVRLQERCDIGTGVVIIPHSTIGSGSIIGAGSVVLGDIPPKSLAVGVPAKVIKSLA